MATSRTSPKETRSAGARAQIRLDALLTRERQLWAGGLRLIAGVDEAGVGPLAGPVVAAAVVFAPGAGICGVNDSKRVAPSRRKELAARIRAEALAHAVAVADPGEIDRVNIYRATLLAMQRAVLALTVRPDRVLVDARTIPGIDLPQEAIVRGDASCHAIAAASILAKVARDRIMAEYEHLYPGYGFAHHKGYPTEAHRDAIRRLGPCAIHRRSFTLLPPPGLW